MDLRILHIAPFNTAGVPISFVKAERKLGYHSRLITLGKDSRNYEEDVCLELPLLNSWLTRFSKQFFTHPEKLSITNQSKMVNNIPLYWQPYGLPEKILVKMREWMWIRKVNALIKEIDFWNFDVYQLDGGLEFFRGGQTIKKLKASKKKIICCYTGSDLRTRGVMRQIDTLSDLNVTLEFDHIKLHPNIKHVFFPFDTSGYQFRPEPPEKTIKIGHAPTNRLAKGSDRIIAVINALKSEYSVELVLIENLPHEQAIRMKSECHIFVDQIGDLGYGINSLESLAMGIPTCSCLAPGFGEKYPEHPFNVIDSCTIKDCLIELINNKALRQKKGMEGRDWVKTNHDKEKVVQTIFKLAGLLN